MSRQFFKCYFATRTRHDTNDQIGGHDFVDETIRFSPRPFVTFFYSFFTDHSKPNFGRRGWTERL